jgi:hypothetical protein
MTEMAKCNSKKQGKITRIRGWNQIYVDSKDQKMPRMLW